MNRHLTRHLSAIRTSIMSGDPHAALAAIEGLGRHAARHGLTEAERGAIEPQLTHLRRLADASLKGARQAAEEVRAIVQAARSLQTYDAVGRRTVTAVAAAMPQRF